MRTSSFFLWTILPLLVLIINLIKPAHSQSLDSTFSSPSISCNEFCGGIHIPYPFGIGRKECFLNDWFEVVCNTTTTSSKSKTQTPFLSKINREVVNINLKDDRYVETANGIVYIKSPVTSSGCSQQPENPPPLNLTGERSPFFITKGNLLISVGCQTRALITIDETQIIGCDTKCDRTKMSEQEVKNKICIGYKCCEATIPVERSQVININLETGGGNFTQGGSCNVAFLTTKVEKYSPANVTNLEEFYANGFTIIELGWLVDTSKSVSTKPVACFNFTKKGIYLGSDSANSCICEYGYFSGFTYSICYCNDGFRGNAYLPSGCIDVDECEEGITKNICGHENCVNTHGSFQCEATKAPTLPRAIKGLIIGLTLLVLIFGIWRLMKFIKKLRKMILKKKFFKRNGGLLLKQRLNTEGGSNVESSKIFSSKELEKATNNFNKNRIIGQGGQGTVYKGMLVDGRSVAVKRSKTFDEGKIEGFINEVGILSQLNHRNIVKLLGCCLETEVPLLVYDYIPNGDLFKQLHDESDDHMMTWDVRLRIAMESAGALAYLHSASSTPVYHKDVKTLNILLDKNYRAKISDFGMSRLVNIDQSHLTTHVAGTFGYVDPEWFQTGQFTEKSDVYSFGVVLVKLITGEKPVSVLRPEESRGLAAYFIETMKQKRILELVDSRIRGDCKFEEVMAMAKIARSCLNSKGKNRPTMREVSIELERIRVSPRDLELHTIAEEEEEEESSEQ